MTQKFSYDLWIDSETLEDSVTIWGLGRISEMDRSFERGDFEARKCEFRVRLHDAASNDAASGRPEFEVWRDLTRIGAISADRMSKDWLRTQLRKAVLDHDGDNR